MNPSSIMAKMLPLRRMAKKSTKAATWAVPNLAWAIAWRMTISGMQKF